MNLNNLEKSLNNIQNELKRVDKDYKELTKTLSEYDPIAKGYYYDTLDPLEREYRIYNDRYQDLISRYSLAYLEMSEWYVGEYLPYNIFLKDIKGIHTYLDSKEDVRELYKLFAFMFLLECSVGKIIFE